MLDEKWDEKLNFNMFMLLLYLNWDAVKRAFIITQKRSLVWTGVENESVKQHQWNAVRLVSTSDLRHHI